MYQIVPCVITPEILIKLYPLMTQKQPLDASLWCLFLQAFFTMGRKSQFVPVSANQFDPKKQLTRGSIFCNLNFILVVFKWSKTIQFGDRVLKLPLAAIPGSILWPLKA